MQYLGKLLLIFSFILQVSVEVNKWKPDQGKFSLVLSMKHFALPNRFIQDFSNRSPQKLGHKTKKPQDRNLHNKLI